MAGVTCHTCEGRIAADGQTEPTVPVEDFSTFSAAHPSAATGVAAASPAIAATQNELHTYQHANGYSPSNARIRAGIPTVWTIDSDTDATCAAYVVVPSLDMQFALQAGRNTVRLPALQPGVVQYMCGMGMYTASITVVGS